MARIELVQNAEWLLYNIRGTDRVVKALSPVSATVQAGELFVTQDSLGWANPDGQGGIEPRAVAGNALENTSFSGASGTGTSELAAEASTEKLKFRAASGDNYKLQGDLRNAQAPAITSLSSDANGTRVQFSVNDKRFLEQTVETYAWRDENDVGWQQVDPPNQKWTKIDTGTGNFVDNGAQDGVQHVYAVQNTVTDIDGTTLQALSGKKTHTFDEDAQVNKPSSSPNNLSLTAEGTSDPPYDFLGEWTDPNNTVDGYVVQARLEERADSNDTFTEVQGGGRTDSGVPDTTFSDWQNAKNGYQYRFRARYSNAAGDGPWSNYSGIVTFLDDVGSGG
jgi:hypothetical protein